MDIMGIGKAISGFLGEGDNSVLGVVKSYFPPSMTETEKAELSIKIKNAEASRDIKLQQLVNESTQQFNDRTKQMEGTASDLKTIPYVGGFIIFLRGCQRPLWGFATLYFDNKWLFSTQEFSDRQEMAFIVINVLVLGFLFGERAVKNLMPLIMKVLDKK
jgi:hypothetical protein